MQKDTSEAALALRELARNPAKRTLVGRVRELLPDIEAARQAGVKLADIAASLRAHGIEVSAETLRRYLAKERAREANPKGSRSSVRDQARRGETRAGGLDAKHAGPGRGHKAGDTPELPTSTPEALRQISSDIPDLDALARAAKTSERKS